MRFLPNSQNQDRKHRTYVYVLIVKEVLEDWEDSVNIGKCSILLFLQIFIQISNHMRVYSGFYLNVRVLYSVQQECNHNCLSLYLHLLLYL